MAYSSTITRRASFAAETKSASRAASTIVSTWRLSVSDAIGQWRSGRPHESAETEAYFARAVGANKSVKRRASNEG